MTVIEFVMAQHDELAAWLRQQIAAEREEWLPVLRGPRRNGKATARDVLARCDAHAAIVDWAWKYAGPHMFTESPFVLRTLALAYQYRSGYRDVWRP